MNKISIIIPVYNSAEYLGKCLESVINQTYTNLEILVINDGSTDGSGKICDEYAKRDTRIKVVHNENGGNSAIPRNVGLNIITGKYVGFVDSDDWIESDMYEKLYNAIEGVEISVCSYYKETASSSCKVKNRKKISTHTISTKDMLLYPLMRDYCNEFCGYVWNKLFKVELFDNLKFDESINWASDVLLYTQLVIRDNVKGRYINDRLYHYNISRIDSVSQSESYCVKNDILRAYKAVEALLPDEYKYWARRLYFYHASTIARLARKKRDKNMFQRMQEEMKEHYNDYERTNKDFPKTLKRMNVLMNAKLVNWRSYDIDKFAEQIGDKSIVCFGAYKQFSDWIIQKPECNSKIVSIVDNNKAIQGNFCEINNKKIRVVSFKEYLKMNITNFVILINTNRNFEKIIEQLDLSGELENVDVYVAELKKYKNNELIKKMQSVQLELLDDFVRICNKHGFKYYLIGGTLLGAARHKGFIPWDDDVDVEMPASDFKKFINLPPQEFGENYFLHWVNTDNNCVTIEATYRKHNTYHLYWPKGYESANDKYHAIGICVFRTRCTKNRVYGKSKSLYDKLWTGAYEKLQRLAYKKMGLCMTAPKTILSVFSTSTIIKIREAIVKIFSKAEAGYWRAHPWNEVFGEGVLLEFEGRFYNAPSNWNYVLTIFYGKDYMRLPPPEKRFAHCPRKLSFDVKNNVWEDME